MEKISGIVRPNARTRSADVSRSHPVRPGAPSWGRPVGKVTQTPVEIEDRISLTTAEKAMEAQPTTYKNRAEQARAKIANDLAEKFFGSFPKSEARDNESAASEEVLNRMDNR